MTPFVDDPDFSLYVGDALDVLRDLPAESVHCCVTSPPYWGLRDYGTGTWEGGDTDCDHKQRQNHDHAGDVGARNADGDAFRNSSRYVNQGEQASGICKCGARRVDQQLGLEPTPDEYVANMVAVFREVRRVLRRDGTLWLNIGDSYATGAFTRQGKPRNVPQMPNDWAGTELGGRGRAAHANPDARSFPIEVKEKDLCGMPWRLAFALQADGWYLRSDIIWSKPNPMPESVTDRPTKAHEYLFLLTRSPRYFYDADAIREPAEWARWGDQTVGNGSNPEGWIKPKTKAELTPRNDGERWNEADGRGFVPNQSGRNKRSVWEIATEAYPDAHFATFPQALVEPCVKAGCPEWVCGTCGKARERQTEEGYVQHRKGGNWQERQQDERGSARSPAFSAKGTGHKTVDTLGWSDCGHNNYHPGVVLDPFMGSGTTAQVARRLGRRSIGIELNPEYAQLCAKRLQQLSLFASERAEA